MRKALLLAALLMSAAGFVLLQTAARSPKLAAVMPGGALLYLEAPEFGNLLREWDSSKLKSDWLRSANYAVFSRSNLYTKLEEVYKQYGVAAGFLPDLKSVMQIAGRESALALYEVRDVEFLYVSRIADSDLMKSPLWALREKFEQRQAGGATFYLRTDPASKRTVAFAFAKGHLLLATRDDLVAQALELLNGAANPSVASDRWYRDATAAASTLGELRLVMNLDSIVKSVYFRSYWVQRNNSDVRRYWTGLADMKRSGGNLIEDRVFLGRPDAEESHTLPGSSGTVSSLVALVPPEAGFYSASLTGDAEKMAALIVQRLAGAKTQAASDWRIAPTAVLADAQAGNEGDLETRIDEQPLPPDAGAAASLDAARVISDKTVGRAHLLVQSSAQAAGTFVQMHSVIVLEGPEEWDQNSIRASLSTVAGKLWSTSQLGTGWMTETAGGHSVARLGGLGTLAFAVNGHLLFLSNDLHLLSTVLDRIGTSSAPVTLTYSAGFRHSRERSNYERVMRALDFSISADMGFGGIDRAGGAPPFFSGNIASLSRVLSSVEEVRVTEQRKGLATIQTVTYQMAK